MKSRVLVFPCGSEIGLEIHQALKFSTHVELFGASSVPSNHGKYVYKNYIEGVPFVEDPDFIDKLNTIIDTYNIDLIYPAHDSVVLKLSENLGNLHTKVIGSPLKTCTICRSKRKTYEFFKSQLSVPEVYDTLDDHVQYPVFLKPDIGQGSRGVYVAESKVEVDMLMQKDPTLIPMEFIPGKEYTVDCFTDRHRMLRFVGARERKRISNGISVDTYSVNDDRFKKWGDIINNALELRGAWFYQVKERAHGDIVLLEIAPRIGGAMGFHRNLGINLPLLSIFDNLDIDVEILANEYYIEMDRALINRFKIDIDYKNVYIDLDDTIIFNSGINVWVIAYLYQCHNKGINIHLLSCHADDIKKTLSKYRIAAIFDTITILDKSKEKSNYISEPSSIFIDDSFSERQRVFKNLRIPTFDLSSLESLLDWRA